jgi:hypothetical protein
VLLVVGGTGNLDVVVLYFDFDIRIHFLPQFTKLAFDDYLVVLVIYGYLDSCRNLNGQFTNS